MSEYNKSLEYNENNSEIFNKFQVIFFQNISYYIYIN